MLMKRFFVFVAAMAAFVATAEVATAQEKSEKTPHVAGYISNKFWDNWELGVGGGATFAVRTGSGFSDSASWSVYGAATKWLHPVFGVRGVVEAGEFGYLTRPNSVKENTSFLYIHPDFMVNLSNWIGGYKERVYNAILFAGAGVAGNALGDKDNLSWEVALDAGLLNRFNVGKALSIDLTIGTMYAGGGMYVANPVRYSRFNSLHVSLGLNYRFNKRTFEVSGATADEAKAMLARLNVAEKEVVSAKAESERLTKVTAEQTRQLEAASAQVVEREAALRTAETRLAHINTQASTAKDAVAAANFDEILFYLYGYGVLNENNKTRLNLLAQQIKESDSDKVYKIEGFADPQTGSKRANHRLAEKRARLVYEYLISQGVEASKLEWKNCGTENLPFNKKEQNRVVVVF